MPAAIPTRQEVSAWVSDCWLSVGRREDSRQLTGLLRGASLADHSPEFVSEKKMRPLKGIALHAIGELGT